MTGFCYKLIACIATTNFPRGRTIGLPVRCLLVSFGMIRLIDVSQPAIMRALSALPDGAVVELAEVPAGATVSVRDGVLVIDDGVGDLAVSVEIGPE